MERFLLMDIHVWSYFWVIYRLNVWVSVEAVMKCKICMVYDVWGGVKLINLWIDVFHLTQVLYDYYMTGIVQQSNTAPIYACVMIMRTVIVVRIDGGNTDPKCMDCLWGAQSWCLVTVNFRKVVLHLWSHCWTTYQFHCGTKMSNILKKHIDLG